MGAERSRSEVGRAGEQAASEFLVALGYQVLARNVRFRFGEIDIVAEDHGVLVFVEVKTRTGTGFGTPAEAVTAAKRARLVRLAEIYLARVGAVDRPCRFDVVAVEPQGRLGGWRCSVVRDAFSAGG